MTLALYGSAARLGRGSVKPLISPAADEMLLELEFEVGGATYRAQRRIRHTGQTRARLDRLTDEGAEPLADGPREVNERVQGLLRLDYEAFCRTVLLPQGEFEEFLVGDRRERREIMNELLRLDRYRQVAELARKRQADAGNALEHAQALVAEYAGATADGLRAAEQRAAEADTFVGALASLSDQARRHSAQAERLRDHTAALERTGAHMAGHARTAERLAERHDRLHPDHERTARGLRDAVAAATSARAARERAEADRDRVQQEVGGALAHQEIEQALLARTAADEELGRLRAEQADAQKGLATRLGALTRAEQDELDASRRHGEAWTAMQAATETARQAARRREQADARATAARSLDDLEAQARAAEASLAAAERALTAAEEGRSASENGLRRVDHRDHALAVRAALADGEPCPVCEQTVASVPAMPSEVLEERGRREAELEAARDEVGRRRAERDGARAGLDELNGRRSEQRRQLEAIGDGPEPAAAAGTQDEADRAAHTAGEHEEEARRHLDERRGARERAAADRLSAEHALARLAERTDDAARRRAEAERTLLTQLGEPLPPEPAGALAERRARLEKAEQAAGRTKRDERAADAAERSARNAHQRHEAEHAALVAEVVSLVAAVRTLHPILCEQLAGGGVASPAEPECPDAPVGLGPPFVAALQDRAGIARRAAATFAGRAAVAQDEIARIHREAGIEATNGAPGADRIGAALEGAREERASARAALDELRRQDEARRTHEARRTQAAAEHAAWRELAEPLQGSGFIDFVIAEVMDGLCDIASAHLREISGERYSLQAEELNFRVIDHFNADQIRDASTLSGGERFLASLALALALAESVRTAAGGLPTALDAVFIDEGFSSLDAESLDVTLSALETLAQREQMVGVVSHVEDVHERIADGFEVVVEHNHSRVRAR